MSPHDKPKKDKPLIEDVIPKFLGGEKKKLALEFVAHLRANKMKPVWTATNAWRANYKGKLICYIKLGADAVAERPDPPAWMVTVHHAHMSTYENIVIGEGLRNIFWDNVVHCVHDPQNDFPVHHCNPNKGCAGGRRLMRFDKEFAGVCQCSISSLWVRDPDETAINSIKRLLELEQKART